MQDLEPMERVELVGFLRAALKDFEIPENRGFCWGTINPNNIRWLSRNFMVKNREKPGAKDTIDLINKIAAMDSINSRWWAGL